MFCFGNKVLDSVLVLSCSSVYTGDKQTLGGG